MVIQWYGQSCFKIQSGDLTLVVDPYSKEIGLTPPRFRADAVLVTHGHFDHSNSESLTGEPFLISGPGEFEVRGVYIFGMETFHDEAEGRERGMNTVYKIKMEDIRILHLGDFGEKELRNETLEKIGDVDVLLVPVGGKYTIDAEAAAKVVKQLEPRFVIPMHYRTPGIKVSLDTVEDFLKEMGATKTVPQEKLVLKKKDMGEDEKTEVIVLKMA